MYIHYDIVVPRHVVYNYIDDVITQHITRSDMPIIGAKFDNN